MSTNATSLRHDLPELPRFMRDLPIDAERGYPVPFFVDWIEGKPEFRIMDAQKLVRCVKERLCWVCGKELFRERVFVVGPMCTVNRISSEPPSHRECAVFSAMACPFLVKPQMVRRAAGMPAEKRITEGAIERNPGVTAVWYTRSYRLEKVNPGVLFAMGAPFRVDWYTQGRIATREEVLEGIEKGLPALLELAKADGPESIVMAKKAVEVAKRLVPSR